MAEAIASKLSKAITDNKFCIQQGISCSSGVTQYIQDETTEEFIGRADEALYIAKRAGKNRTEIL